MVNKMMHCPSAVDGAETKVEATDAAVKLTITSADKAKVAEIQKRAQHLASLTAEETAEIKHTGQGTGGGALGKCPVVMDGTTLVVESNDQGAVISMTVADAAKLPDLAKTASARAVAMSAEGGDDDGEDKEGGW